MTAVICVAAASGLLVLDLAVKQYIEKNMPSGQEKEMFKGRVLVRKVHNKGLMLNAFDRRPKAVKCLNGLASVLLCLYLAFLLTKKGYLLKKTGAVLMTGGALSNTYDHMVRGYVVDYFGLKSRWKKFSDVTFNLADIFIFIGGIIFIIVSLVSKEK